MDISRVGAGDVDLVLPLLRGYCDFYAVSPSDAALEALVGALVADPVHEGVQLLARRGGRAVGFATVYWTWSTLSASRIAVMNDLYVDPAARLGGVGRALIERCRHEAAAHGAVELVWQTAPDNETAQALYDAVGGRRSQWVDYSLPVTDADGT